MNTRLQVEHPVTELVTGIDLVEQMIRVASGEKLSLAQDDVKLNGWAIESRLYAEDPYRNFLPSIGRLTRYRPPVEGSQKNGTIIRNDTGVFEGGEISMYYDPMIAKLCTWAPERIAAIDAMSEALDRFEVEGIGHNLPFLSAVMQNQRFREGNLTTGFIGEEFPEGFSGIEPDTEDARKISAIAALIQHRLQTRASQISGTIGNHRRVVGKDWVVSFAEGDHKLNLQIADATTATFEDGTAIPIKTDWFPGQTLALFTAGDAVMAIKVDLSPSTIRLRWRGMDVMARVRSPRVAELARLMPKKLPPDTSKMLLCPMPGVLTTIAVTEGDRVEAGQALATVEAMKMENILRAERSGRISKIAVKTGDSLAVDEVILEFE
jgi:propionyl-CoA carboxylase alpha chain